MSRTATNIRAVLIQTLVAAVSQFLVYRFLYSFAGASQLGAWSVILAITGFASIANFGIGGGVIKLVAEANHRLDRQGVQGIVSSALYFAVISNIVLFLVLRYGGGIYLKYILGAAYTPEVRLVLNISLLAVLILGIGNALLSVLDGMNFFSKRALISSVAYVIYTIVAYYLVKTKLLTGMAYAGLVQAVVLSILVIVYLKHKRIIRISGLLRFNRSGFAQVSRFGLSLQSIGLIMLLFDPITKYFITTSAGLTTVAYYEMANKLVLQVRNLVVSANQVIVPKIAPFTGSAEAGHVIRDFFTGNTFAVIIIGSGLVFSSVAMSYLWLGEMQPLFIQALIICTIGWVFNMLTVPQYFYFMGLGKLRYLLLQHIILSVVNTATFLMLPADATGYWLYFVPAIALTISSVYLMVVFIRDSGLGFLQLWNKDELWMIILAMASFFLYFVSIQLGSLIISLVISLVFTAVLIRRLIANNVTSQLKALLAKR